MALKYKVKSLIDAATEGEVMAIAQQCNCFCTMGSGIAPLIAEAFPEARDADNRTDRGDPDKLGTLSQGFHMETGLHIYNLYGQYHYGLGKQHTDYDAIERSLIMMNDRLQKYFTKGVKVGLPKIGAGLGGGDWDIISSLIEQHLTHADITIYVLDEKEIPQED